MNKPHILVVEDDEAIRNLITSALTLYGYPFHTASTGTQALLAATSHQPDIMLLDLGLPDMDGVAIIRKIRSWSQMPVIVVSARSDDRDKIDALDAGADDYITKPFSVEELLARIRVVARRLAYMSNAMVQEDHIFVNGGLKIDYQAGCVWLRGQEIHLTPMEYKVLCLLAKHVGKVLTHRYITQAVWGNAWESNVASLRVFMVMLRKKIETDTAHPEYIQTHIGIGYRMMRIEDMGKT